MNKWILQNSCVLWLAQVAQVQLVQLRRLLWTIALILTKKPTCIFSFTNPHNPITMTAYTETAAFALALYDSEVDEGAMLSRDALNFPDIHQ
jgi:hypothetical protein